MKKIRDWQLGQDLRFEMSNINQRHLTFRMRWKCHWKTSEGISFGRVGHFDITLLGFYYLDNIGWQLQKITMESSLEWIRQPHRQQNGVRFWITVQQISSKSKNGNINYFIIFEITLLEAIAKVLFDCHTLEMENQKSLIFYHLNQGSRRYFL